LKTNIEDAGDDAWTATKDAASDVATETDKAYDKVKDSVSLAAATDNDVRAGQVGNTTADVNKSSSTYDVD